MQVLHNTESHIRVVVAKESVCDAKKVTVRQLGAKDLGDLMK